MFFLQICGHRKELRGGGAGQSVVFDGCVRGCGKCGEIAQIRDTHTEDLHGFQTDLFQFAKFP